MKILDYFIEKRARDLAHRSSRRDLLTKLGSLIVGASAIPLLPVARAVDGGATSQGIAPQTTGNIEDPGDPTQCDYWRYCAIDGFLCACCGGTRNTCPPGTEMSPLTWIGTCTNPADGKKYIISYNDCCGKPSCGRCLCNTNESDIPAYRAQSNNDINWCLGASSTSYTCSTAIIVGTAL